MKTILRIALLSGALLLPAAVSRGQGFTSYGNNLGYFGFWGPYDGYSGNFAYPTSLANGPSPYYSPIFNSLAASPMSPVPSPYYRSPIEVVREHLPFRHRHEGGLFRRR